MASYLESLQAYLPQEMRGLSREKQIEWLSELLSHQRRHRREEEQQQKVYEEVRRIISEEYRPLHAHLYHFHGWKVTDSFRDAVTSKDIVKMKAILTEEHPGVYTFDILSKETCQELVEEVQHFEKWCKEHQLKVNRPNSMNNYGAILDDFGFKSVLDMLMKEYIQPFSTFLYPVLGQELDSHHGFVVEYGLGKDTNLGFHVDDTVQLYSFPPLLPVVTVLLALAQLKPIREAIHIRNSSGPGLMKGDRDLEVTLNVCLGDVFTGGQLFFKGVRCDKHVQTAAAESECFDLEHKVGMGVFHVGRHRHGANDLTSGYRINLIVWCRSSHQRQAKNCGSCSCHSPCPEWCGLYSQHSQ